jgi:hypothetical protein
LHQELTFFLHVTLEYFSVYEYQVLKCRTLMMAQSRKPKLSSYPVEPGKKNEIEAADFRLRAQRENTLRYLEDGLENRLYGERQGLLLDVANLRGEDAITWFWKRWGWLWPETPQDLIELRDELQQVWRSDVELSDRAASGFVDFELIFAGTHAPSAAPANHFLNKWLSWRPSAEQEETRRSLNRNHVLAAAANPVVRSAFGEDIDGLSATHISTQQWWNIAAPFKCSLLSRRLIPEPHNLRAMLVQGVLEHWGRLKYCANTHCLSPYFIARRKDQTVCDAEICKAEKQREHARKWWNENRSKKAQDETNTGSKIAKKRSKGSVTRKTR